MTLDYGIGTLDSDYTVIVGEINIDISRKVDNDFLDNIMVHRGLKSYINLFTKMALYGLLLELGFC